VVPLPSLLVYVRALACAIDAGIHADSHHQISSHYEMIRKIDTLCTYMCIWIYMYVLKML